MVLSVTSFFLLYLFHEVKFKKERKRAVSLFLSIPKKKIEYLKNRLIDTFNTEEEINQVIDYNTLSLINVSDDYDDKNNLSDDFTVIELQNNHIEGSVFQSCNDNDAHSNDCIPISSPGNLSSSNGINVLSSEIQAGIPDINVVDVEKNFDSSHDHNSNKSLLDNQINKLKSPFPMIFYFRIVSALLIILFFHGSFYLICIFSIFGVVNKTPVIFLSSYQYVIMSYICFLSLSISSPSNISCPIFGIFFFYLIFL
jgi:hypothetical protein